MLEILSIIAAIPLAVMFWAIYGVIIDVLINGDNSKYIAEFKDKQC